MRLDAFAQANAMAHSFVTRKRGRWWIGHFSERKLSKWSSSDLHVQTHFEPIWLNFPPFFRSMLLFTLSTLFIIRCFHLPALLRHNRKSNLSRSIGYVHFRLSTLAFTFDTCFGRTSFERKKNFWGQRHQLPVSGYVRTLISGQFDAKAFDTMWKVRQTFDADMIMTMIVRVHCTLYSIRFFVQTKLGPTDSLSANADFFPKSGPVLKTWNLKAREMATSFF